MKTICAWCAKKRITTILSDDTDLPLNPSEPVSHGICKPCYDNLFPERSALGDILNAHSARCSGAVSTGINPGGRYYRCELCDLWEMEATQ